MNLIFSHNNWHFHYLVSIESRVQIQVLQKLVQYDWLTTSQIICIWGIIVCVGSKKGGFLFWWVKVNRNQVFNVLPENTCTHMNVKFMQRDIYCFYCKGEARVAGIFIYLHVYPSFRGKNCNLRSHEFQK